MLRLGQDVFHYGVVTRDSIQRSLYVFERFSKRLKDLGVKEVRAVATSALRECKNRKKFIEEIRQKTGVNLSIISGEEEARIIAQGILENEKLPQKRFVLLDIGGGSSEVSLCTGKRVLKAESLKLGTARIQERFLKTHPPGLLELDSARLHIRKEILSKVSDWPETDLLIGSSGTLRTLAQMVPNTRVKSLKRVIKSFKSKTLPELLAIKGMEAKRADMMLGGALIAEDVIEVLGIKKFRATEFSLRDGLISVERQKALKQKESGKNLGAMTGLESALMERATQYALSGLSDMDTQIETQQSYQRYLRSFTQSMMGKLDKLLRLSPEWKNRVLIAVSLRDVGERVSSHRHPIHSEYIVREGEWPGLRAEDRNEVAWLVRNHEEDKVSVSEIPKKDRAHALRAHGLLRLIDVLDTGPHVRLEVKRAKITKASVQLKLAGKHLTGFEQVAHFPIREMFRRAFKKKLDFKLS